MTTSIQTVFQGMEKEMSYINARSDILSSDDMKNMAKGPVRCEERRSNFHASYLGIQFGN